MESQVLHHRHADHDVSGQPDTSGTVTRDPVCGMTVDPHAGKPTAEHGGRVYHFCGDVLPGRNSCGSRSAI